MKLKLKGEEDASSPFFYVILNNTTKQYFRGYDPEKAEAITVDNVENAKWFSNKYDIRLRPNESIQEIVLNISDEEIDYTVSDPFRPRRRKQPVKKNTASITPS